MKKLLIFLFNIVSIISFSQTDYEQFKQQYIKNFGILRSDSLCKLQIDYAQKLILNNQYIYPYQSLFVFDSFENEIWPNQTYYYLLEEKYNIISKSYLKKEYIYPFYIYNTSSTEYCLDYFMYNKIKEKFGTTFFTEKLNDAEELELQNNGFKPPLYNIKNNLNDFYIKHSKFSVTKQNEKKQNSISISIDCIISKEKQILFSYLVNPKRIGLYPDLFDDFKSIIQKIEVLKPATFNGKPIDYQETFSIYYNKEEYKNFDSKKL